MNRGLFTILFVIAVFIVGGLMYVYNPEGEQFGEMPKNTAACTEEAKLCPDGSYVGRNGPNCDFDPCPSVPTTTPEKTEPGL